MLAESSEHTNLQVDGIDDLLMIKGSGLQGSADFGNVEAGTITPLTKSCLELWRSVYGCRFGSYDAKPRVQIRDKKRRTAFAHLRREVLAAAHSTTILPRTAVPFSKYVGGAPPPGGFGCLGFVHTSTQQIPASHQGEDASCQGCNAKAESRGRSISCHED